MTDIEPEDPDYWNKKGAEFYKQNNYDEAKKCFFNATKLNPNFEKAWYNLSIIYHHTGKNEQSELCLRRYNEAIAKNRASSNSIPLNSPAPQRPNLVKAGKSLFSKIESLTGLSIQDEQIVKDYLKKYLSNKTSDEKTDLGYLFVSQSEFFRNDRHHIGLISDNERTIFYNLYIADKRIKDYQTKLHQIHSISEKNVYLRLIEGEKFRQTYFEDLKKFKKLFQTKKISITYSQIVKSTQSIIEEEIENYQKTNLFQMIESLKQQYPDPVVFLYQIERKIRTADGISATDFYYIYPKFSRWVLLKNIGINCDLSEVNEFSKRVDELSELSIFEENLGKPQTNNSQIFSKFNDIDGYQFEELLSELFKQLGYSVIVTPKSGDQGADLIFTNGNETTVVQAKKYEGKVPNSAVQQIVAAKNYYSADKAMVVTTSYFTQSAVDLAIANDVILWDIDELNKVISDLFPDSENEQEEN